VAQTLSKHQLYYRKNRAKRLLERQKYYKGSRLLGSDLFFRNRLAAIKSKAIKNNLKFNLTLDHIKDIFPLDSKCPALGIKFKMSTTGFAERTSASLDRIIPKLGYTKGNVIWVSMIANRIMSDANADEVVKVAMFFKKSILKGGDGMSDTTKEDCPKCGGSGLVHYDENHSTKCWVCCPHDKGWWLLNENYKDAGKLCCRAGCGTTKDRERAAG